jgi:hypothetical protein
MEPRIRWSTANHSLQQLVEMQAYKNLWLKYRAQVALGLYRASSLTFQQKHMTVRIANVSVSTAGNTRQAMTLVGDGRSDSRKLCTLVHEFAHRLLSGNTLGAHHLGMRNDSGQDDLEQECEHRLLYVILSDAIHSMDIPILDTYADYEYHEPFNNPHTRAFKWVQNLDDKAKNNIKNWLHEQARPRELWNTYDRSKVQEKLPGEFLVMLDNIAAG